MDNEKKKAIELLVDSNIKSFSKGLMSRYEKEKSSDTGVINMKKKQLLYCRIG